MRVAQIAPLFESVPPKLYGGTERVINNLARGLTELGIEVTTFCSGDSHVTGKIEQVWPEALRLASRKIIDPFAYQVRMLEAVARRAHEFDIIHNHYEYPMLLLNRMTPTPLVSTMHYRMDMPDLAAAMDCFQDARLISISNSQRKPLPYLNWITTILHGIDVDSFQFNPGPGRYLAFLGRFSPEKGAHWAIDIARRAGIPLIMAAKIDDTHAAYFEREVKPLIDGRFVQYVGEISEAQKSEFLGNAIALLNPINWPEPFGLVMIEAMACGTPVLTRPVGSTAEIMQEGVTGFSRSNIHELARLIENVKTLDRAAIRRYASEHFSIERMTREYLNVYRQLIAAGTANPQQQESPDQSPNPRRVADNRWNLVHSFDGAVDGNSKGIA